MLDEGGRRTGQGDDRGRPADARAAAPRDADPRRRLSVQRHDEPEPDDAGVARDARPRPRPSARCSACSSTRSPATRARTLYKKLIDSKTRDARSRRERGVARTSTGSGRTRSSSALDGVQAPTSSTTRRSARCARSSSPSSSGSRSSPTAIPSSSRSTSASQTRVIDLRRQLAKFLDSPPGFGFRGTSAGWMDHLDSCSSTSRASRSR